MKAFVNFSIILVATLMLAACTQGTSDQVTPDPGQTLGQGIWTVSYYWDEDHEETQSFAGYTFVFGTNQEFTANAPDGSTQQGSWAQITKDNQPRLVITINADKPLSRLDKKWVIKLSNETKIELGDDNLAQSEILHFSRK